MNEPKDNSLRNTVLIIVALVVGGLVAAGLVGGGIFMVLKNVEQKRQAMREFNASSQERAREMQQKIGKEDTVKGSTEKARQIQESFGKAASKVGGNDAKALKAGERFVGLMQSQISGYEKSYTAFMSKGGLTPESLTSNEAIDERLALLKTFETANKAFTEFLKGAENKYRTELIRENFPASRMDEMVRGFRKGSNLDTLLAIRGTDAEMCVVMAKYLELLKREWGKWKLNEESKVIFKNAGVVNEFNGYGKQIKEVVARQTDLQQKVLKARLSREAATK